MTYTPTKQICLIISLRCWNHDQRNNKFFPVRWCSSWPGTTGYSALLVPLFFRDALILCDNLPKTVRFHVENDLRSFKQSTDNHNTAPALPTLTTVLLVKGLPLLKSSFNPLRPSLSASWWTQKHVWVTWCNLHTLAQAFRVPMMEFSPTKPEISGFFIPHWPKLNDSKQRLCEQKHVRKSHSYKKVTVIHSQDITFVLTLEITSLLPGKFCQGVGAALTKIYLLPVNQKTISRQKSNSEPKINIVY